MGSDWAGWPAGGKPRGEVVTVVLGQVSRMGFFGVFNFWVVVFMGGKGVYALSLDQASFFFVFFFVFCIYILGGFLVDESHWGCVFGVVAFFLFIH